MVCVWVSIESNSTRGNLQRKRDPCDTCKLAVLVSKVPGEWWSKTRASATCSLQGTQVLPQKKTNLSLPIPQVCGHRGMPKYAVGGQVGGPKFGGPFQTKNHAGSTTCFLKVRIPLVVPQVGDPEKWASFSFLFKQKSKKGVAPNE